MKLAHLTKERLEDLIDGRALAPSWEEVRTMAREILERRAQQPPALPRKRGRGFWPMRGPRA